MWMLKKKIKVELSGRKKRFTNFFSLDLIFISDILAVLSDFNSAEILSSID